MSLPTEPYSRIERYLAKLAGQDVDIPDRPITRIECYLDYLVNNGGGVPEATAGAHNAIFRGTALGTGFTEDQADAIAAGTFDGIFVGDYWTINNRVYRVAGFDLFYNLGDTRFTRHHAVIVPDKTFGTGKMNDESVTTGGYAGSLMKTAGLVPVLATITQDFGEGHILTRRSCLTTGVGPSGAPSTNEWADTSIDLMSEGQVLGRGAWGTQNQNGNNVGERYSRFPLFCLCPSYVNIPSDDSPYWLQDVRSSTSFALVSNDGSAYNASAAYVGGIRPYFCVGKVPS